jgi:hypothetical protein
MSSKVYQVIVKGAKGILSLKYRSPDKLEVGEDLLLFYDNKTNLVKITDIRKGVIYAEETQEN